ncbi:NADH dehydrogenase [ubiquinone] 1 alpha subcomplex subunit 8 [Agrilus planipennis]|uniref:NADH dehydrogenase [ubiquinone] 1 alpha subcomplex subunit 8 n=1 Tax=Agrilus planipennis TaxID=224129 RepID=A0A1W4WV26_AGRPL|nr:NADH dehydrogenase [ubiquinone] 1 alpha subcomplex subunit 8 [Agrilus planipennis]
MGITKDVHLPTEAELTVPEVKLSGPALKAAAFHLGKYCQNVNNEFVLCRDELGDPRACIGEGKAVTACALKFLRLVKSNCAGEFTQYANCLDKSSTDQSYSVCRKTQAVFDKCMLDKLKMERPYYGYFAEVQIHDSKRPKPKPEPPLVFTDTPDALPADAKKPPAKYGSRYLFAW